MKLKYVRLPFFRIRPYREGVNPFDSEQWPNEPDGFVNMPVVCSEDMTDEEIELKAIKARDELINEWLELGNCYKEEAT